MSDEIQYLEGKQPDPREHRLIFRNVDRVDWDQSIDRYLADGGYEELRKALDIQAAQAGQMIESVSKTAPAADARLGANIDIRV